MCNSYTLEENEMLRLNILQQLENLPEHMHHKLIEALSESADNIRDEQNELFVIEQLNKHH